MKLDELRGATDAMVILVTRLSGVNGLCNDCRDAVLYEIDLLVKEYGTATDKELDAMAQEMSNKKREAI